MKPSTKMTSELAKILNMSGLILLIIFMISCSQTKTQDRRDLVFGSKEYADSIVSKVSPKWFKGPKRFNLVERSGEGVAHMFFDVDPDINLKQKTMNFIVETPQGSDHEYAIDLLSGQHYFKRSHCKQKDLKKSNFEDIKNPPYTQGIIPRMLDQLGLPQKIIVFGDSDYYMEHFKNQFFDARIIGAVVEQICPRFVCESPREWKSRLVLVGVQRGENKYKDIQNIKDLKKIVNWTAVNNFFENGKGHNFSGGSYYQGYRMGAMITASQGLKFLSENSIYFSIKKMSSMRRSCYKLYDLIWKDLGYVSNAEQVAKSTEDTSLKAKNLKLVYSNPDRVFSRRLVRSFRKYEREYTTCSKYVYPTNINWNKRRHWFFTYYTGLHHLNELGYSYSCSSRNWINNPYVSEKERAIGIQDELKGCSEKNIDKMMDSIPEMLSYIRKQGEAYYKYIDYDNSSEGTHNKLYSWVKAGNKHLKCIDRPSKTIIESKELIFPSDVKWESRSAQGSARSGEVIY